MTPSRCDGGGVVAVAVAAKKIEIVLLLLAPSATLNELIMAFINHTNTVVFNSLIRELLSRVGRFPKTRCVLCLEDNIEKRSGGGCCQKCDLFAELFVKDHPFAKKVQSALDDLEKMAGKETDDTRIKIVDDDDTFTHSILIPYASILRNTDKLLFYACLIAMFFRIRETYRNDKTKAFTIRPSLAVKLGEWFEETSTTAAKCYSTFIQASLQVPVGDVSPDFWLIDDEVRAVFHHSVQGREHAVNLLEVTASIGRDTLTGLIKGGFSLEDYECCVSDATVEKIRAAQLPFYLMSDGSTTDIGRCCAVRHPSFAKDIVFVDDIWLEKQLKTQAKKAKDAQERKEQERKEKQERRVLERRQQEIQRREQEIALRAARATLVTAVAKIDADLERINRLKELNREVALKNRKIFERKEAEKLAAAAAARHAEKLKQKEEERKKFISKKN